MSVDDEEMKYPDADNGKWPDLPESRTSLGGPSLFLRAGDHGGARAKAGGCEGEEEKEESETSEV